MFTRLAPRVCELVLVIAISSVGAAWAQTADEADKLNTEAIRLYQAGKYAEGIPIAERALALREKLLGADHLNVAISVSSLAKFYSAQQRLAEAEPLHKRALAIYEKALGPEHPNVATALSSLGSQYQSQGRYGEAELLFKRALAINEKALGPEHQNVATLLISLAGTYRSQGRYGEAEPLLRRSLATYEKLPGQDGHVAIAIEHLAALFGSQGRYGEAEPLHKRALAMRETALGPEHPNVASSLALLARLYVSQGRYGEAEPLYKRSLTIREKAFGPEHTSVAAALAGLASLYNSQGRYSEAEPLHKRALAIYEKALGPEHPDTATTLNSLAELYLFSGRYGDAEPLFKRSLSIREKALGPQHADVALTLSSLANLYLNQDRYNLAEPLHKRALDIREKALGSEHANVATSLTSLASTYHRQGRYSEIEPLHKRALAIYEKALGPEHPNVAASLLNLAALYRAQGRFNEAEPLFKRCLSIRERVLGQEHPSVASALTGLASMYEKLGRYGDAEPLQKRALAIYEKALGPEHPDVAIALNGLAGQAMAQHDFVTAADRWQHATAILQRRTSQGLVSSQGLIEKGEAQQKSAYFAGLIKATHRQLRDTRSDDRRAAASMFEAAQWGIGSEAAASLAQMAARSATASPALTDLVRERQDLVKEWQVKDKRLVAAKSDATGNRNAAAEKDLSVRIAAIDARLAEIDSRLAVDFPDYAALSSPRPSSADDVRSALKDNEALVLLFDTAEFKPLPQETFVWVVTKTEVRWFRSELGTTSLTREVAALRCGLDAAAWWASGSPCPKLTGATYAAADQAAGKFLPFDAVRAHGLYKSILGEAAPIIKGKNLLVVPSGALTTLPFQVLVTEPPSSKDLRSARWLIRDHAITVLPSVASLAALRRTGKSSSATKPMIGFGNPLLDGLESSPEDKELAALARKQVGCAKVMPTRTAALRGQRRGVDPVQPAGGLADLSNLRAAPPLPETADELCAAAREVKAEVDEIRVGARATETEVKKLSASGELAKYRIIHFATHGTLAGELRGTSEPGLILTPPATATTEDDGYLSGSEIASLKLDAEWVILSACNTAGGSGKGEAAEALSGLARAFFYAGARALLVSHWQVDSDAAVNLVTKSVGAIAQNKSVGRAEALRRAMLTMMVETSRPAEWVPAWHPSVWAPFVVVGEGAAGKEW